MVRVLVGALIMLVMVIVLGRDQSLRWLAVGALSLWIGGQLVTSFKDRG